MTEYYLNNITGSDSNSGTSEADAWASFAWAFGITAGLVCGDTLWVKGTTSDYTSQNITFPDDKPKVRVYGYSSATGDSCSTGLMPSVNSSGTWSYNRIDLQNFVINPTRTVWYGSCMDLSGDSARSTLENLQFRITDTANSSIGIAYGGSDSVATTIKSMHFSVVDSTPSARVNTSNGIFLEGNNGSRVSTIGCILDGRNVIGGTGLVYSNNTGYSTLSHEGSIFIGDPDETHNGLHYIISSTTSALRVRKCIFYNLDVAIKLVTSLTDNSSLYMNNNATWIIEDCVFVNCGTGIELDANIPNWISLTIKNCIFYNMTSYEINGNATIINKISATQNPYDPDNYCLSDYGNSLIDYPYRTWNGSSFVINERRQLLDAPIRKFGVTDTGSLDLGTGGVGDTVTVSGRSFQKVDDDPIVWRRV